MNEVDRTAAIEAAAEVLLRHRIGIDADGFVVCGCGWRPGPDGYPYQHVAQAAIDRLTAPRWVTCPTCRGTKRKYLLGPGVDAGVFVRCPDCKDSEDGTVPADPYLTWADEWEQVGWRTTAGTFYALTISDAKKKQLRVYGPISPVFVKVSE